jgi:hypothetical protein
VYGIYYRPNGDIGYQGERKPTDPVGYTWQDISDPEQVEDLKLYEMHLLFWDGSQVTLRSESDREEIIREGLRMADESFITRDQMKAFAGVILDEINRLRELHGLNPRTPEQLRTAFHQKLNR